MQRCCVLLEESTYRLQKMADECREHMDTACLYAQERALLSLTYEKIAETRKEEEFKRQHTVFRSA